MKKVLFIVVPLLLMGYLIVITMIPRTRLQIPAAESKILYTQNQENKKSDVPSDHVKQDLNCKSCHICEYPTKGDPCLQECPRENLVSVNHSPDEGPDVVVINEMSENYTGVVFSHKIHAQMSVISTGCTGCHHYNTTGPVLNCRKCHENPRSRENVSVPDLKAAYHRQCMACHKEWSHENGCSTQCHLPKGSDSKFTNQNENLTKSHPKLPEPKKMVWETNSDEGKIVTFFHDEHVKLFKINCTDCHQQDNCSKCHESKTPKDFNKPVKIKKSFNEHHKPCSNCHAKQSCQKCHQENEMVPFNHGRSTGWILNVYHSKLACSRCHGNDFPFKKLDNNCLSCHKNFAAGKYDHKAAGLILSESHKDLECNNCHIKDVFGKKPECTECHDDKSFPAQLPGKRGKK